MPRASARLSATSGTTHVVCRWFNGGASRGEDDASLFDMSALRAPAGCIAAHVVTAFLTFVAAPRHEQATQGSLKYPKCNRNQKERYAPAYFDLVGRHLRKNVSEAIRVSLVGMDESSDDDDKKSKQHEQRESSYHTLGDMSMSHLHFLCTLHDDSRHRAMAVTAIRNRAQNSHTRWQPVRLALHWPLVHWSPLNSLHR